jgi:hypothetical protein
MQAFWTWLMRANARAVFAGALVALLLVCAWWLWREVSPPDPLRAIPPRPMPEKPREGLGIAAYLTAQLLPEATLMRGNPFLLVQRRALPALVQRILVAPPPPVSPPAALPPPEHLAMDTEPLPGPRLLAWPPPVTPPKDEPPEQPPDGQTEPPRVVTLTYRGIFKRPDGRVMVLLQDSESGRSAFYEDGAHLHGVQLGRAGPASIRIRTSDGRTGELRIGQARDFKGGRYVD